MLLQDIEDALIAAIKAGDTLKRDTLRGVKASIKNQQIESQKELSDADIVKVIAKEVKKRLESVEIYQQAGKSELADQEQAEINILQNYLPAQLSAEEISNEIQKYLNDHTAAQISDIMRHFSQTFQGKVDMAEVSKKAKELLS